MKRFLCGLFALWIISVVGIIILFGCTAERDDDADADVSIDGEYYYTVPITPNEPVEYAPIDTSFSGEPADIDVNGVLDTDKVGQVIVGDAVSLCGLVSYTEDADIAAVLNALRTDAKFYRKGIGVYTSGELDQYLRVNIYFKDSTSVDGQFYILPDGTVVYCANSVYYITPAGAVDYEALYPMSPAGKEESWVRLSATVTPADMIGERKITSAYFGGSLYSSHLSLATDDKELIDRALTELCAKDVMFTARTDEASVITFLTFDACTARFVFENGEEAFFYITADGSVLLFSDGYFYRTESDAVDVSLFWSLHYGT